MKLKQWLLGLAGVLLLSFGVLVMQQSVAAAPNPAPSVLNTVTGGLNTSNATANSVSTCHYANLGWVICPVLRTAAQAADNAFTFVTHSFMQFEISLLDRDSGAAQAVGVIRNVANVLFVLVFLVIIYSLISGQGVGNYNLKRMLPRFVVAIILVQVSFYVCMLFVDATNIIGSAIQQQLVNGIANNIGPSAVPIAKEMGDSSEVLSNLTSNIISNGSIAWELLAPLTAVVISAAVICAVLIVILIIRKTLVVALVLFSPIAFVLYLLPGTSEYFNKWLRLFVGTLVLFPVVAFLLGTGQIVSASILKAGTGGTDYQVQNDQVFVGNPARQYSATLYLVAAGAAVLPLVGTWYAFKATMGVMDAAGSRVAQRGLRRSSRERDEDTKRREQTAMDMNKKSMMMRGINRLQQLNVAKDGESTTSIFGRVGAYRGRGKHQTKSAEQAKFDEQVQQRLSEMRGGGTGGLTPQEMYAQALQRYQDRVGDMAEGGLNINSYEGIELKASEAYLLESLGKGMGESSSFNAAILTAESKDSKSKDKDSDKKHSSGSSNGGGAQEDSYKPAPTRGVQAGPQAPAVAAQPAAGATMVQQGAPDPDMAGGGTGFMARRSTQGGNEALAKARANKYLADVANKLDNNTEISKAMEQLTENNDKNTKAK